MHNHFGLLALDVKLFEKGVVEFAKDRGHHLELGFASDEMSHAQRAVLKKRCGARTTTTAAQVAILRLQLAILEVFNFGAR